MKKLYVLILVAIKSSVGTSSQNYSPYIPVMTSGAPMPVGVRYPGSAGYSFNDSAWVYVLGGLAGWKCDNKYCVQV